MKENGGFYNSLKEDNEEDAINQLAGHELSHQWWGTSQLSPQFREGGWVLTETLAKYTELMIFKNEHGEDKMKGIVRHHIDQYLANRSFSHEMPLYKTTFETPHIAYNKGLVVMYQLYRLIGEKNINIALNAFLSQHRHPRPAPVSTDLLREIYKVSPPQSHTGIDEIFKKIVTYDAKITQADTKPTPGLYEVTFEASSFKYEENGQGKRVRLYADDIEIGLFAQDGRKVIHSFRLTNNRVKGRLIVNFRPARIVIDPLLKQTDIFPEDNERILN